MSSTGAAVITVVHVTISSASTRGGGRGGSTCCGAAIRDPSAEARARRDPCRSVHAGCDLGVQDCGEAGYQRGT